VRNPLVWITVANVIYLASYSVRDILWLRILTVVAASLLIPYYALQPDPLHAAIRWSVLFIAINLYWIVRLILERRPVRFTPDQARLRELSFPSLTPREALALFKTGVWHDLEPGVSLLVHDRGGNSFSVILRGDADVIYRGQKISEVGEGHFVGVIDVHAEKGEEIDVFVRTASRVMSWSRQPLQQYLVQRPDVALALQRSLDVQLRELLGTALSEFFAGTAAAKR
jgi:CRP-like cAMP-binding protein